MKEMKQEKQTLDTCDCCDGVKVLTPVTIYNRAGLTDIKYRAGTHGSFLQTMKARLSSSEYPKLAALTTRESSDASIAMLDAWATVADVLTFYQERIATEGYLRTAAERRSILELARLVGYRLRPGLSASVYLAYTLEPTQETTIIEAGNKAQSLPGPKETPQVFETADRVIAHAALNVMKPRLTQQQFVNPNDIQNPTVVLKGTSSNLRANDGLLLNFEVTNSPKDQVQEAFYRVLEVTLDPQLDRTAVKLSLRGSAPVFPSVPGDLVKDAKAVALAISEKYSELNAFGLSDKSAIVNRVNGQVKALVESVARISDRAQFIEAFSLGLDALIQQVADEYAFASARGYDNIAAWLVAMRDELEGARQLVESTGETTNGSTNSRTPPEPPSFVQLFRPFKLPQSLQPASEARLTRKVEEIYSSRSEFVAQMYGVLQPQAAPFVKAALANAGALQATPPSKVRGPIALTRIQALRLRTRLTGYNMPVVTRATSGLASVTQVISPPNLGTYLRAIETAIGTFTPGTAIALDAQYDQIKPDSRVTIEHPVLGSAGHVGFEITVLAVKETQSALLKFSDVPMTVTVLILDKPWLTESEMTGNALESNLIVRSTSVFAQSEELERAETDITEDIGFDPQDLDPVIELDGLYSDVQPGAWAIISGERVVLDANNKPINTGVQISELLMVSSVAHQAITLVNGQAVELKGEKLHTFIHLAEPPAYRYRRSTLKIYGNVVRATHGETRNEVLGSGDGSKLLQTFPLRQPPVTYLAAPTPAGAASTLEVRVNDLRWREAANLFVLDRLDRNYVTRTDDSGKTTVLFGDGEHGARLPTGVENIKAVYRSGIGSSGNVKAEQIKLPLTKPLGVKGVINPLPASGGADRETRDQARRNAPIGVLALDRLVSVQDYADFARTFAGIAKASARRLSDGVREVVHLTISGVGDIPIDVTSDLYRNLVTALKRFGDPTQPLQVETSERVLLVISAKVKLLPDYLWERVNAKIRALLFERFGFENRDLGQDVTQSEVLSAIQSAPGVDYVDLDLLDSVSEATLEDPSFAKKLTLNGRVNAELARINVAKDNILPAQLVFLSPAAADVLILEEVV
jgi:hypothetical protein